MDQNGSTFQTMADNAPVMIWIADSDGKATDFNEGWLRFTGRELEREIGDGWHEDVHPEDREAWSRRFAEAGGEPFEREFRLRRHDGEYRWVLDRGAPIESPASSGYAGACIDVTDVREDQEALRKLAEERTAALESFTYSASHDLKAPLRTIVGFAKILKEDYAEVLGEDGQSMLQRQIDAAKRMERLIGDLLQSSRLDRAPLNRVDFDLSALARDVAAEICNRDWGCEVRFDIPEGLTANGDPNLLRYVLQNLFENGVKYSKPNGSPQVVLRRTPEGAFSVRDNGVGFDMRYADKLFKPFERLHNASEFPGSGIGLSNVEKVVRRHGGSVWAESAPGQGATFYFTLD